MAFHARKTALLIFSILCDLKLQREVAFKCEGEATQLPPSGDFMAVPLSLQTWKKRTDPLSRVEGTLGEQVQVAIK